MGDGKLQNQIRAIVQGHSGTNELINDGRFSSLGKITAQNHNVVIRTGNLPGLFQMIFVTVMEGIIFGYDSVYSHYYLLD